MPYLRKNYRTVTDSVTSGYQRFAAVQRVGPQFYVHNPGAGNIPDTLTDPKVAKSLIGKMFFTLINDRDGRVLSIVPPVAYYTERINGGRQACFPGTRSLCALNMIFAKHNSFYIRSTSDQNIFWFYDASNRRVVASKDRRSKFTITIREKTRGPGAIIIGSDEVYITVNNGTNVGINTTQDFLGNSDNPFPFKFSSIVSSDGDFQVNYNWDGNVGFGPIVRNPGKGDSWELV
ncbi:hypothetical protein H0H81_006899 [Sphagnurus paluster]|uniref:Uncharacterized protein n=1 Tax=Sphagnurus paluster TaxID=117069 RepID=A0A9P7FT33_9AGAR|nr:hypothetical protein H0H81_006899 [Sphagnurus paluster]